MVFIIALIGCGETNYVDESTIDFPIFLLFFNTKFPIFPIFSIPSFLFSYFFLSNHAAGHPALIVGRPAAFSFPEPLGLICNEPRYQETTGFGDENGPAVTAVPEMFSSPCTAQLGHPPKVEPTSGILA